MTRCRGGIFTAQLSRGQDMRAVEQGRTRCPRCAAWTEYRFLEIGSDKLEYEVRCDGCGHVHSEVTPVSPAAAA
ncbi:hypothetical protein A5647_21245 [Mycobacterium sp. 1100029.7]|nr:hypothetical protein A5647_21245 [Mycobacterium sp. 1100029.7]